MRWKRLSLLTISTCLLLASAAPPARADEGEEEARAAKAKEAKEQATHDELKRFIDRLYAAMKNDTPAAVARFVDPAAFSKRAGEHVGEMGGETSGVALSLFALASRNLFDDEVSLTDLDAVYVRRIEAIDGEAGQIFRVVVYESFPGWGAWTGWHVHRVNDEWRVVDKDLIDLGLRATEFFALTWRALELRGATSATRELVASYHLMAKALRHVNAGQIEQAGKTAMLLEGDAYPAVLLFLRASIIGGWKAREYESEEARRWADEAIRLRPLAPLGYALRARIAVDDEAWQEALDAGRRHHDLLGPDPEIDLVRARAHLELNEPKLAYPLALRASAITKGDHELLWVLLGSAPKEQRAAALAAGLEGFDDQVDALRGAADWIHGREIPNAMDWVLSEIKRRSPDDWFLGWHAGRLLLDEEKYEQAWPKLAGSFRAMGDPGWREVFQDPLIHAGLAARKLPELWQVLRTFETERDARFQLVVGRLEESDQLAELRAFIDAAAPDREHLPTYERTLAKLLLEEKAYDRAIELLLPTWEHFDKQRGDWKAKGGVRVDALRARLRDVESMLFRAALRGQRRDLTLRLARRAMIRDDDLRRLVLHYLSAGDRAAAMRALQGMKDQEQALIDLWIDEDLGSSFRKPPFRPIFDSQDIPRLLGDD